MARLTKMQAQWAIEYAIDRNATQAAIRAGYSEKSASNQGSKNLNNPLVMAEVVKQERALIASQLVTKERIVQELAAVAFADMRDFADWSAGGISLRDSADVEGAAVAEVAETAGKVRIKLHDKMRALELLGKYLAMWTDRVENAGDVRVEIQLPEDLQG